MTWFRVDDNFWAHPKVVKMPDDALALWLRAGSWCAQQLTDGAIPLHVMPLLSGKKKSIEQLVFSGLWIVTDDGYQFHDWAAYQPSREEVLKDRAANAARVKKHRELAREKRNGITNGVSNGVSNDTPTRPDPTRPNKDKKIVHPRAELTTAFDEWWKVYPRKQAKADALKAYAVAHKEVGAEKLLSAVRVYALTMAGEDKNFVKLPGGWLRSERWTDEPIVNTSTQPPRVSRITFCPSHDGYPLPCDRCARDAELPEGNPF